MKINYSELKEIKENFYEREYKIKFVSKRNKYPEKGVEITSGLYEWNFDDIKLGFLLKVNLIEIVNKGKAEVIARVKFKKFDNILKLIDKYVFTQLELISKDGMVKL